MGMTKRQVLAFKDSYVWREIAAIIEERIGLMKNQMVSAPINTEVKILDSGEVKRVDGIQSIQGGIQELEFVLKLPDIITQTIEEEENVTRD